MVHNRKGHFNMAGLAKICKLYGGMTVNGVSWKWDYANDRAVKANDMKMGSDAWKKSEIARAELMRASLGNKEPANGRSKT